MTEGKKKIILLQHYFNEIGGIETFIINFCKIFGNEYDISLVTRSISFENALTISKYANVICDFTERVHCDILILTSVLVDEPMFKLIDYDEIYRMVHSDWTEMRKFWDLEFKEYDQNTKYISVSDAARESYIREFGKDSIVIPNLVDRKEPKLRIASFTRLTEEKGYKRMCQLCDLFKKYDIPYSWDVFGTNPYDYSNYGNMNLYPPIKNAQSLMSNYDYIAQFSDTESFCYTMYESLMEKTPVLVTPFPNAIKEIVDGENGYILPFDMNLSKKDIEKIANKIPKNVSYEQEGVEELWKKILK
jgi:glycosyltransferase involved in cell wall biosynthesis